MTTLRWACRDRGLDLNGTAAVMGILNVTPDSFSDGGQFLDHAAAVRHGVTMAEQGAAILDVGGESSRPGAQPVPVDEELRRVLPVIAELVRLTPCLISVDTTKAIVAEQAVAAGAHIINDITALTGDPAMAEVARRSGAGVVLMHMRGTPGTMQADPRYGAVVSEVCDYLRDCVQSLVRAGLRREQLAVDPGIGFGKTVEHNVELLRGLPMLVELGYPVLVGVSRKSFLGKLTGCGVEDRLAPSLAALAYAIWRGAHILRVHDVKESCEAARLLAMFGAPIQTL